MKTKKGQVNTQPAVIDDDLIEGPVKLPEKKKKSNKKLYWIISGAVLIVLIIVLIVARNAQNAASKQTYQTEAIQRGNLVAEVGATGTVRAKQSVTLAWQTSGRIESIDVEVGDQVAAGDTLATLAQSSLPQSIILAQSDLFTAKQALSNVQNSTATSAAAALDLAQAHSDYKDALEEYWTIHQTYGSEDLINNTTAKLQIAQDKVDRMQEAYDKVASYADDNVSKAVALQNLTQARMDRDAVQRSLNYVNSVPDQLEIDMLDAKLQVAKAALGDAEREYERVKDGVDPEELAAAEAKVAAVEATVNMASLTAPFTGTITQVDSMVGDQVSAGTATFRIDDLNNLMVDIKISEVDINSIKVGQPATLTFDAIQNAEYSATVTEVARVGDSVGGVVEFEVTLQITNPDELVLPGMTAAVNIAVENKQDVLLAPNRAIRLVNEQYVIYVIRDDVEVMVPIVIGSSSDAYSEIISGDVYEGDQVILNPSTNLMELMQSQSPMGR
jgi:HlyD family secretion protein